MNHMCHFMFMIQNVDIYIKHKKYKVVPDERAEADGDIRVVDESEEDYLYSQERFVPIRVPVAVRESLVQIH